jgi:hypothetical protein
MCFILFCISTQSVFSQENKIGKIYNKCVAEKNIKEKTKLGTLLRKTNDEFLIMNDTTKNKFTQKMDNILSRTSFSYLLMCPENLNRIGYKYRLNKKSKKKWWSVTTKSKTVSLNLFNKRPTSLTPSLFTYAHEMLHVCQVPDKVARFKNQRNVDVGKKIQFKYLDEVAAFKLMSDLFIELLDHSPVICNTNADKDNDAYKYYIQSEKQINNGTFGSSIIYRYLYYTEERAKRVSAFRIRNEYGGLDNLSSPALFYFYSKTLKRIVPTYELNLETKEHLRMHGLNPTDKFPYELDFQSKPAEWMQEILAYTNCYHEKIDNNWGNSSKAALTKLSKLLNINLLSKDKPEISDYLLLTKEAYKQKAKCS